MSDPTTTSTTNRQAPSEAPCLASWEARGLLVRTAELRGPLSAEGELRAVAHELLHAASSAGCVYAGIDVIRARALGRVLVRVEAHWAP